MPRCSNKTRVVATAVLLGSALAGCSDIYLDRRETVSFGAKDATATAQAVQTVDPWPPSSANRNIESNGVRVAGAIERYRTGQIIQPKGTGTSSVAYGAAPPTGQGGGGTGGGGAPPPK
jgi:hypothetical protein